VIGGSVCERLARGGEARLRRGVIHLVELKRDGVTRLRGNVRRLEGQDVYPPNHDPVVMGTRGRGRGRFSSRITHCDRLESWEQVPRVDGKNHALFAVTDLLAKHPHGVRVIHLVPDLRERAIRVVIWHRDADRRY
jgi:hypothetical protein